MWVGEDRDIADGQADEAQDADDGDQGNPGHAPIDGRDGKELLAAEGEGDCADGGSHKGEIGTEYPDHDRKSRHIGKEEQAEFAGEGASDDGLDGGMKFVVDVAEHFGHHPVEGPGEDVSGHRADDAEDESYSPIGASREGKRAPEGVVAGDGAELGVDERW